MDLGLQATYFATTLWMRECVLISILAAVFAKWFGMSWLSTCLGLVEAQRCCEMFGGWVGGEEQYGSGDAAPCSASAD